MHDIWNPWHGCIKCSEGCQNCYMYFLDQLRDQDGARIYRTQAGFDYPLQRDRKGSYKIQSGELIRVCMTSDFFLEEADPWREDVWDIISQRPDVKFFLLTKRPQRMAAGPAILSGSSSCGPNASATTSPSASSRPAPCLSRRAGATGCRASGSRAKWPANPGCISRANPFSFASPTPSASRCRKRSSTAPTTVPTAPPAAAAPSATAALTAKNAPPPRTDPAGSKPRKQKCPPDLNRSSKSRQ